MLMGVDVCVGVCVDDLNLSQLCLQLFYLVEEFLIKVSLLLYVLLADCRNRSHSLRKPECT